MRRIKWRRLSPLNRSGTDVMRGEYFLFIEIVWCVNVNFLIVLFIVMKECPKYIMGSGDFLIF
jgi:hypothetical protein